MSSNRRNLHLPSSGPRTIAHGGPAGHRSRGAEYERTMATLFVGDVHGCASELEELLDDVDADRVVLVGDLFLKGPDPEGVWSLVRDRRLASVLGNHDDRLLQHVDGKKKERVV